VSSGGVIICTGTYRDCNWGCFPVCPWRYCVKPQTPQDIRYPGGDLNPVVQSKKEFPTAATWDQTFWHLLYTSREQTKFIGCTLLAIVSVFRTAAAGTITSGWQVYSLRRRSCCTATLQVSIGKIHRAWEIWPNRNYGVVTLKGHGQEAASYHVLHLAVFVRTLGLQLMLFGRTEVCVCAGRHTECVCVCVCVCVGGVMCFFNLFNMFHYMVILHPLELNI
jgi:hypothetical protein